ncbi:hypothetical protein COU37_04955 [Candidatus Micrarchaeota archaeon CG10_big_fil_rev_8_21_14_0_10_45_29]|nr:MAG: hypothetical protein COU37_04955 [Candidatus Micrarchaeota archaeon CG10_big_fil_rev_8_21_14_0_10_45_29]
MKINNMVLYSLFGLILLAAIPFAVSGGFQNVACAAACMCGSLKGVLPVIAMLMVIGAGVVYAAGQMMGAETRARANTWATAMLVGAIIGILITVVAPAVLNVMYQPSSISGGSVSDIDVEVCTDQNPTVSGYSCGNCYT